MKQTAIEALQLTRDFNGLRALDSVTFSVHQGEIFGFLGPNGAGKTTTLRILTGQLRPTSGTARVMGFDVVADRRALKPLIGVVFEYQNLYQRLSARDNLNFTARLYGVSQDRVEAILEKVGLQDRAGDSLKKYSNGMKQRLLIARALLHRPKVLFLDEPTRGLDPAMAQSIRSIITLLAEAGMTIFLTTHYMEEADQLCSRVAILDLGRMVALDTPEHLKQSYPREVESAPGRPITLEDVFLRLTGRPLETA